MAIRIVSDSSSDVFTVPDVNYTTVPLKVMFASTEYVDEVGVDCEKMMLDLQNHNGPSTTSCPNIKEWLNAFEGYDEPLWQSKTTRHLTPTQRSTCSTAWPQARCSTS